jgi:hypothetical protein
MFSRFFIDRPIFAAVLSIFIVIAGLASIRGFRLRNIPRSRAGRPGAGHLPGRQCAGAGADRGGAHRERHQRRRAHALHELHLGRQRRGADPGDLRDRHRRQPGSPERRTNRVKQAEAKLPLEVRRQGVTVEKGSSSFLQVLAFYSPDGRYDDIYTSNFVTLNVLDQLKRLPGTTNVQIFGAKTTPCGYGSSPTAWPSSS